VDRFDHAAWLESIAGLELRQAPGRPWQECYLPDLKQLEALQLVQPGTVVAADNVIYPGAAFVILTKALNPEQP
jgi:hypothetical protein